MRKRMLVSAAIPLIASFTFFSGQAMAQRDFSGVWSPLPGTAGTAIGGSGLAVVPASDPPVPYNAEYRKDLAANQAKLTAGFDVRGMCQPPGMPQIALSTGRFEFVNAAEMMLVLYETQSQTRRVFMNAEHPESALDNTTLNGHSTGRWDGETLVIDTVGMKDFTYLNRDLTPHSEDMHTIERWTMPDRETLHLAMEVIDPRAFTAPWKLERTFKRQKGPIYGDYECNENPVHQLSAEGKWVNIAPAQ